MSTDDSLIFQLIDKSITHLTPTLQALHQGQTMEGCSAPLVVKFADTQKEKDAKRVQSIQSNLWNFAAGLNSPLTPSPVPVASPIHTQQQQTHTSPYLTSEGIPASSLQLLQQIQAFGLQQQLLHGKLSGILRWIGTDEGTLLGLGAQAEPQAQQTTAASLSAAAAAGLLGPISVQNLLTLAAMSQSSLVGNTASQQNMHNGAAASLCELIEKWFEGEVADFRMFFQGLELMHWPHKWPQRQQRPRHHYHNLDRHSPRRLSLIPPSLKPSRKQPANKLKGRKAVICSSIICRRSSPTRIWRRLLCPSDTSCQRRCLSTSKQTSASVSALCRSTMALQRMRRSKRCTVSKSARNA